MKHFKFLAIAASALLVAAALSFSACGDEDEPTVDFKVVPTSLEFDAAGGSKEIAVTGDWDATPTTEAAWLTLNATATKVTVTAEANTGDARTSTVKIGTVNVTVTQKKEGEAVKKLSANPTSLTFIAESAPTQDVTVTAENVGTWSANSTDSWITVTEKTGAFTVSVSDNAATAERTGTISLTATEYTGVVTITVTQSKKRMDGEMPEIEGVFAAAGTPSFLQNPGPSTFNSTITMLPEEAISTPSGTEYWDLYEIASFAGQQSLVPILRWIDNTIVVCTNLVVAQTQDKQYYGVTSAFYLNPAEEEIVFLENYEVKWNSATGVLDFSGKVNGFDVLVGIVAFNASTDEVEGGFGESYIGLKMTRSTKGTMSITEGTRVSFEDLGLKNFNNVQVAPTTVKNFISK